MSAFTVHCNSKTIDGFNRKEVALWWVVFVQIQTAKKCNYVSTSIKKWQCCSLRDILVACREIWDYNIQSRISPCLKKQIWIHSLHAINMCGLFTTYFSQHEKRVESQLRWCVLFNCGTNQMTDRTALNGPWLLQCIRCSYVCQRNSEKCSDGKVWHKCKFTLHSLVSQCMSRDEAHGIKHIWSCQPSLNAWSYRKHRQHEADLLSKGRLWKGESRIVIKKQTSHDEPNMSRRSQELSHSRFCKRFSTRFCKL